MISKHPKEQSPLISDLKLPPGCSIKKSTKRRDERGFLVDFLKLDELEKKDKIFGQAYCVTFNQKSVIRGNHYHVKKREWFVAINGKLEVILEDIKSKNRVEFVLDGDSDEYERVEVGPNIAHAFRNISKTATLINYCNKPYHFENPDTLYYKLF